MLCARRAILVPLALLCALVVSACGTGGFSGVYNASLPGGADIGDAPYRVTAQFEDVRDLVPQAGVHVNDVPVGRVDAIRLAEDTQSAEVTMSVHGDVELPANADAALRQTSLLGEKFVELREPVGEEAEGRLTDGELIPLERTNRGVEVEELFGALSLLLSGGGIEQVRDIASELNDAFSGNSAEINALLTHAEELTRSLDGQTDEIVAAIDGLDELSGTLRQEEGNLVQALDELEPGLDVVSEQTDDIVEMLGALDDLSEVTVDTIEQSKDQTVDNLRALEPTLRKLAEADQNLVEALKIMPTYPLPWNAGDVVEGDFANVNAEFDLNLDNLIENISNSNQPPLGLSDQEHDESWLEEQQADASEDEESGPELPLPSSTDGDAGDGDAGDGGGLLPGPLGGEG